jgi:hypothetical protein
VQATSSAPTDRSIADEVFLASAVHQALYIEPGDRAPLVIPRLLIEQLGLDDSRFDEIAAVYDHEVRRMLCAVVEKAKSLL